MKKMLHIVPGDSAGGSLARAIRDAGRNDEVLRFRDDLGCGPIDPDEPSTRVAWWDQFYDESDVAAHLAEFWERVAATDGRSSSGSAATPRANSLSFWLGPTGLESGLIGSLT